MNFICKIIIALLKLHIPIENLDFTQLLDLMAESGLALETTNINDIPYLDAKAGALSGKQGFEIYSITGYFAKKLVHYENIISQQGSTIKGYSFPIIRLSDLYLMYSEALNEVKESPDAEVYEYIQKVRHKAGLDNGGDHS